MFIFFLHGGIQRTFSLAKKKSWKKAKEAIKEKCSSKRSTQVRMRLCHTKKIVTRGYNIVLDRWAGANSPLPTQNQNDGLLNAHFQNFQLERRDQRTGQTDRPVGWMDRAFHRVAIQPPKNDDRNGVRCPIRRTRLWNGEKSFTNALSHIKRKNVIDCVQKELLFDGRPNRRNIARSSVPFIWKSDL